MVALIVTGWCFTVLFILYLYLELRHPPTDPCPECGGPMREGELHSCE